MRLKPAIACAGLLAGALLVMSQSPAHAAPTRYEAESSPSAVCSGTIDTNWSATPAADSAAAQLHLGYAQFSVNASTRGHGDSGRPVCQRHHHHAARRAGGQRIDGADAVVRGDRRLVVLVHHDGDRSGERR